MDFIACVQYGFLGQGQASLPPYLAEAEVFGSSLDFGHVDIRGGGTLQQKRETLGYIQNNICEQVLLICVHFFVTLSKTA